MILNLPVASRTALLIRVLGADYFASIGQQASYAFAALHTKRNTFSCFPPASPLSWTRPGKQKTPRRALSNCLIFLRKTGAGEAIRTLDPNLGKQKITPSMYSITVSQISFQYASVPVLPVFVEVANRERNDTPVN
jgi:hypothetical protein